MITASGVDSTTRASCSRWIWAAWRSATSRTSALNRGPRGVSTRATDTSTWSSCPSRWCAVAVMGSAGRWGAPAEMCRASAHPGVRSGRIVSHAGRPIASAALQPNSRSAAGFQSTIRYSASVATNASWALSMIDRVSRSRAARARLAARRSSSVMTLCASSVRISISISVHSRGECAIAQNEPSVWPSASVSGTPQ